MDIDNKIKTYIKESLENGISPSVFISILEKNIVFVKSLESENENYVNNEIDYIDPSWYFYSKK